MGTLFTVFLKEVLDNFRDRRTLGSALLMGPIFGPILFAFVINLSIERSLESAETTLELPVIGEQHAPNLVSFLRSRNIEAVAGPADAAAAMEAVKLGTHDVVLVIPEEFGEQLGDMVPARVALISDQANSDADRDARRATNALLAYQQLLAGTRVIARGINPRALQPLNIDEVDVSTPSGRSAMLLGMMSYFFVFAALMGGMYLAIDTTAGERERGSLEPLLSLPVTRDQLIYGKIAATCLFMTLSLMLSLTAFYVSLKFMPLEQLGMTPNFGPAVVLAAGNFPAVYPGRRSAHDARCLVYQELPRSTNLVERGADCSNNADSYREHPDTAAAHGIHVNPVAQPAPAARGYGQE